MPDPTQLIVELLRRDHRYKFDAYAFVYEALAFAHDVLRMGADPETPGEEPPTPKPPGPKSSSQQSKSTKSPPQKPPPKSTSKTSTPTSSTPENDPGAAEEESGGSKRESRGAERHLTGQQLCEAIRLFALEQYGLMAKKVLNSWGVTKTGDFGEIVYNLIGLGLMRKTDTDRREDFDDVYDFETGLNREFKITLPEA